MPVTLQANYREVFTEKTLDTIDRLSETRDLEKMIQFVDEYGEANFVAYYEDFSYWCDELGEDVVRAFVDEVYDLDNLDNIERYYVGEFASLADFAEYIVDQEMGYVSIPIVIDYWATGENLLEDFYDKVGDHYFRSYI